MVAFKTMILELPSSFISPNQFLLRIVLYGESIFITKNSMLVVTSHILIGTSTIAIGQIGSPLKL